MRKQDERAESSPALLHQVELLQEQASKDALSGLLNRVTIESYVNQRLEHLAPGERCAMFVIDLDNFKRVNDTLGHPAGDLAIRQAARTLSGLFRGSDIVGRLGGDEFGVFLSGRLTLEQVRQLAQTVCTRLRFLLGSTPCVELTASVGLHFSRSGSHSFDSLYRLADAVLYQAKGEGGARFCLSTDDDVPIDSRVFSPVHSIPLTGLLEYLDSGVALVQLDRPMQLIYVSPSFCRLLGADPQSFPLPHPLSDFVHPDDALGLEQSLTRAAEEGKPAQCTLRFRVNQGGWSWWYLRAVKSDSDGPTPVLLVTTTDITDFKESELRLKEVNQRLQIAFSQTTQILWEVDIPQARVTVYDSTAQGDMPGVSGADFPEGLIASGWIHPDSAPRFRQFAAQLLEGRSQGFGNFILRYLDSECYGWAALSYRMLFDPTGRPAKAVGILENLPQSFNRNRARSVLKRPLPQGLAPDLILGFQGNLTQDVCHELWLEGKQQPCLSNPSTCTQLLDQELARVFPRDCSPLLTGLLDRAELLDRFQRGERWLSARYRRTDGAGDIQWVRLILNLAQDPLTHEVHLFIYLCKIDLLHQWEQELSVNPAKDPVTQLYTRSSFRSMAQLVLERQPGPFALALVQLGGLSKLYASDTSHLDQKRYYIAAALCVCLGGHCLMGQYSSDTFLLLFPGAHTKFEVRKKLESSFDFARTVLSDTVDMDCLRFVAGVDFESQASQANYPQMLSRTVQLCQLWRNAPADAVIFSREDDDWSWSELQRSSNSDCVQVHHEEMSRPLSDQEKDVALECVAAMLDAGSLDASIHTVLRYLGTYYRAERVYVLVLAENRHIVTMPFEWTAPHKPSIQQAVSGMMVDRFPLLVRCMQEQAPVFLTRQSAGATGKNDDPNSTRPWYFTVLPLIRDDGFYGFLCLENAQEHPADAALFTTLIPHMLRERQRFQAMALRQGAGGDSHTPANLPNLRSYMDMIYSMSSDTYSSLGAVCLDVPDLSAINSSLGFEYGSKLLWFISKTLGDIFGPSLLFRTWDAEFVALCPNTSQQVFLGRCNRLRIALQRRYPKQLRIGHTWSDGFFNGKALVNEARAIMRCERVDPPPDARRQSLHLQQLDTVHAAAEHNRLTVFFQPKIELRSGHLVGAEALVRGMGADGSVIPPARFIDAMEADGSIRDLDLFVLDHTLATMDRWRQQKLPLVPVSVNFSRLSLLNPSALASVLAIQSRYPQLSSELLELEITESAVSMDRFTFTELVDRFRDAGMKISLDDFGSQYANLSTFTNVHFDTVKLDRSLIAELSNNPLDQMLVRNIIGICNTCGMTCVAEGVESEDQRAALVEMGCQYGQGYFFDRPMPASRFAEKYLLPAGAISQ